jgi:hypothetical protein
VPFGPELTATLSARAGTANAAKPSAIGKILLRMRIIQILRRIEWLLSKRRSDRVCAA